MEISCSRVLKLMGNRFEFTVIAADQKRGEQAIDDAIDEVRRIEELLSTFKETSQTNYINDHAGLRPVTVDTEVVQLILRSLKISKLTQGAFDITYGSIDKSLWNFDVSMTSLPDKNTALQAVSLINYQNVIVDAEKSTVLLKNKGMRLGFGGIGKGYAADKAKQVLLNAGIKSGIVNAAGDLITWGTQIDGRPWTIGIADPNQSTKPFSSLKISNMSIATSGNYEKYAIINGQKYSHTIDPKTGLPVTGIKSVSILCPNAELADALATPIMVMGIQVGLDLINQLKQVACILIDDADQVYTSENINIKH
ncbi:FAD:protein FMN transferase [Pedobacter cryoconitis]|uniref:FAD:protein FMN transferase n=1 Tax=Pedobacter cryoconitis TaxID=188932 RepID=A0A7X0J5E0_9SPHI|nr:FAD:protein FMN transferase [Pedobacter cryoconitis]MBB6501188.1 thiamine biosynthesis lipoprotein [Pedobacter cryoconitis]